MTTNDLQLTERTPVLFEPVRIGTLTLPNRIVMAPMTRALSPGGVPGPDVAEYYRRRAADGVGLIITEGTWVPHPAAANEADVPRMYGPAALEGWAEVVRAVHQHGGHIFAQLWHVGQFRQPELENLYDTSKPQVDPGQQVGPSGLVGGLGSALLQEGRPATTTDIDAIVDAYASAATNAHRLGFDGIELHGAHGYLLDQFFWDVTNQRTDRYGGSIPERVRLIVEIADEIRRRVGPQWPVSLRISQWKQQDYKAQLFRTPRELEQFLAPLIDVGIDVFHCSQRRFWEGEFGTDLNLAGWVKKISGKPTISVGSVTATTEHIEALLGNTGTTAGIDRLLDVMERGDFDMIAVGRGLLADPHWVQKIRRGAIDELVAYTVDHLIDLK
jgi:2,4-dienoyl-CoA reductase-like NADH-dependent reductase (Old Yellow Enzyme family)